MFLVEVFLLWLSNRVTSEVDVRRNRALVRFASPSMFIVPRKLVLIVLIGLYLQVRGV